MNILEPNYRILVSVTGDNSITITSSPSFSAKSVAQVEKNQWRKNLYKCLIPGATSGALKSFLFSFF